MILLGIDPGEKGGLALVNCRPGRRPRLIEAMTMPIKTVRNKKTLHIYAVDQWLKQFEKPEVGVCELVSAMPKQGVSSSFQFGRMFGAVETVMYAYCETQHYIPASKWKQGLGLSSDKSASIDLATRMFGQEAANEWWPVGPRGGTPRDGVAEAALIAYYFAKKGL